MMETASQAMLVAVIVDILAHSAAMDISMALNNATMAITVMVIHVAISVRTDIMNLVLLHSLSSL